MGEVVDALADILLANALAAAAGGHDEPCIDPAGLAA
jgi:hypothetical protein